MLTEKQVEILNRLDVLKKEIDLLDSHFTVGLASEKQYQESLKAIDDAVTGLYEKAGVREHTERYRAKDVLRDPKDYERSREQFDRMYGTEKGWIRCSDMKPEFGRYIVYGKRGAITVSDIRNGRWTGGIDYLYWRELPEPPQGVVFDD